MFDEILGQFYEEAIEVLPTATMLNQYAKFLNGVVTLPKLENKPSGISTPSDSYIPLLLRAYEKVKTMGYIDEDLACQHISFLLQLGRLEEAQKLADNLCSGIFSNSVKLWQLRISIGIRHLTRDSMLPSKAELLSIYELFQDVLTRVSVSEAESLWLMVWWLYLSTFLNLVYSDYDYT